MLQQQLCHPRCTDTTAAVASAIKQQGYVEGVDDELVTADVLLAVLP